MINDKRIYFTFTAVFFVLFLSAFGHFFITDGVSMKASAADTVYSIEPGTSLKLNSGWQAFSDRECTMPADVQADIFRSGNYFFRLNLATAGMQGQNAFLVNHLYSAYRIWVNGELLLQSGTPGEASETLALMKSVAVPYFQQSDELEIVIQISNHSNLYGGSFINWIAYGEYQDIAAREMQGKILDFLIVFGLLGIALLHLFNYFYQHKYAYSMFLFLYLFIYATYALFSGRVTAANILPVMNGAFILRTQNVLLVLAFPVFMNYIRALFPDEIHRASIIVVQIISLAAAVALCVVSLPLAASVTFGLFLFKLVASFYILIGLIRAVKARRETAVLTLIGFFALMLCMINDLLNALAIISTIRLIFAGLFFFAVQQTVRLVLDSIADYRAAEEAHQKLADVTNQRESFISRNSIELEKPIRNIVELGESLLKGSIGPLNSEQIATTSLIVSNGTRLTNMLNDIFDFTKIKDNAIELHRTPVVLPKLLKKVLNSCEALVAVNEVELVSNLEQDMPPVSADERRFEQILYNLISNSIRHTERGSINVDGSRIDDLFEIVISIEGSNLEAPDINALFNAYEQGRNIDLDKQDVSDLSLAIARKLIELHESEVSVTSENGKLEYRFAVALWNGEIRFTEEEALEMDALINLQPVFDEITSDRNIEVLIAGKDVEELQILKSQLSSMNYSVIPTTSGADLLRRVEDSLPQLVVIDVKLPDMSGYEVCSRIREDYSKDELPVILVINKEDISDMMEGLSSGANDFLTRPYLQEEFLTRVNTHLQLSRISNVYSRYVPTEFLNALGQENIVDVELGDQVSREMTILFVDIRAFTNLSENMTPEENFKFINSYLSRFSPMITNNGGFVDKYIGDAIMALFPDNPENALAAAAEMIEHVNVYNGHRANCGYRPINIGIGIHTGNMILGIIGDEKRMQGTVISDAVNLASRIQDVTKLYKANIVISQATFIKLENPMDYNFRFLGRVKVKGKDNAVALFEIFDADIEEKRDRKNKTKSEFEEAIMKFSRRNFDEAKTLLEKVAASDPDDQTTQVFLERIEDMRRAEKRDFLTSL